MSNETTTAQAMRYLSLSRSVLTRQQFLTLRGQIIHGDPNGALRGLKRLLMRGCGKRG